MESRLAARRLEILHVQLAIEKTTLLVSLDRIEDLAQQLQQYTAADICPVIGSILGGMRREVAELGVHSAMPLTSLNDLAARLNSAAQVVISHLRALG